MWQNVEENQEVLMFFQNNVMFCDGLENILLGFQFPSDMIFKY